MINEFDVLQGSYPVKRIYTPAGGFVTGCHQSANGRRRVHWTDAWNGLIREEGDPEWRQMFTADTLGPGERTPWLNAGVTTTDDGVFAAWIDQTNDDNVWAIYYGQMFYSTDFGHSWEIKTGFTPKEMESNTGVWRRFQFTLCGHPSNNTHFLCGTNNDGVYYTTDGWTTENLVTGITATTSTNKYLVYGDPGDINYWYIHSPGTGLYQSTTGITGPYNLIASSPTTCSSLVVTPAGLVLMVSYGVGTNRLWSMPRVGSGFTAVTGSSACDAIAVNPFDPELHWVVTNENGAWLKQTYDAGATWITATRDPTTNTAQWTRGDGEVQWLANRSKAMFTAGLMFSNDVDGELFICEGVGINRSIVPAPGVTPSNADPWVLHDYSAGNYELVATKAFSIPGADFVMFMDKPTWRIDDFDAPNNMWTYAVATAERFGQSTVQVGCWLDYAPENPDFVVLSAITNSPSITQQYGYSTNRGLSFTKFPTQPFANTALSGGCVAVSTVDNFIVTGSQAGAVARGTLDGGESWFDISFGGYTPVTHWNANWYNNRENIIADKANPGHFYALVDNIIPGTSSAPRDIAGIWKSEDGGLSWEQRFSGCLQNVIIGSGSIGQNWGCGFKMVPGFPGELVYADCIGNNASNGVCLLTDDGTTITGSDANPLIRNLIGFGFGPAAPGQTRPSVWFYGTYNGTRGLYISIDWWATATLVAEYPAGHIGSVTSCDASMNKFGRALVGMTSNAFATTEYKSSFAAEVVEPVVAVPEIWFMWGDSNGYPQDTREAGDTDWPGVFQVRHRAPVGVSADTTPLDQLDNSGVADGLSLYEYFAKERAAAIGANVYIVARNFPGTQMSNVSGAWGDGLTPGNHTATAISHYNTAIQQVQAIEPTAVAKGFMHTIGTNDASGGQTAATTKTELGTVRTKMLTSVFQNGISGATVGNLDWIVIGTIPEGYGPGTTRYPTEIGLREFAQENAANNVKMYKVPEGNHRGVDTIHYSLAGHRAVGAACSALLLDTAPPTSTFPTTYTLFAGQKMLLDLTSGLDKYAWCALDGAGAGDFEITIIRDADTGVPGSRLRQYLRWNADGTKTAGTYAVDLKWTSGNGQILTRTFTVTVEAAYGAVVETIVPTQQTHFTGAVPKDSRNRPNIPVTLGRGKNLIYIQNTLGPLTDITSVMFNGIAATRDANSSSSADTYLYYLNSAVDQSGTLIITPSSGGDNPVNMDVMIVSVVGTTDAVASSSVMPSAQRLTAAHETASLTCPASGIIIGLGMIPSPTTIKTGCTSIYLSGNYWSQYRTTTGVCGYTGGNNQFSRFAAAALSKA